MASDCCDCLTGLCADAGGCQGDAAADPVAAQSGGEWHTGTLWWQHWLHHFCRPLPPRGTSHVWPHHSRQSQVHSLTADTQPDDSGNSHQVTMCSSWLLWLCSSGFFSGNNCSCNMLYREIFASVAWCRSRWQHVKHHNGTCRWLPEFTELSHPHPEIDSSFNLWEGTAHSSLS